MSRIRRGVEITDGVLYRARIAIPARVPVGDYTAETFLIQDGRVIAGAVARDPDREARLRALRRRRRRALVVRLRPRRGRDLAAARLGGERGVPDAATLSSGWSSPHRSLSMTTESSCLPSRSRAAAQNSTEADADDRHDELQSFPAERGRRNSPRPSAPRRARAGPRHEPIGQVVEIGGGGAADRARGRPPRPSSPAIPIPASPCPARSAASQARGRAAAGCSPTSAALQAAPTPRPAWSPPTSTSSARARRIAQTGKLINFRRGITGYPIPGSQGLPGHRRRPEADVRRRRARPYRDRHRLSDQGRARRALCRRPARQAFRPARLDRHRQVDRGRPDHAPHLRPRARGPYRHDRPARRIFGGVQGPSASCSTSTISPCPTG